MSAASFCATQKQEIIAHFPKSRCCRYSFFFGALALRGDTDGATVCLRADASVIQFFAGQLPFVGGKNAVIAPLAAGGRARVLRFESSTFHAFADAQKEAGEIRFSCKCGNCRTAFLRGMFLACGRVSDPDKQYCIEFSCKNRENILSDYLKTLGFIPKIEKNAREVRVGLRTVGQVEDFLALLGLHGAAFGVMNAKIESEIRGGANRVANCETNNIGRAVAASARQTETIDLLRRRGLLSSLPAELEATARLRLAHRDLSLSQLAALCVPPLTKSGLSHRLNRIVAIGSALFGDKPDESIYGTLPPT